jgi:uncharacterized protein YbjQ (UPF0145 family)
MLITTTLGIEGRTVTGYLGAAVGVDIDYETVGSDMLMISASGTAVRLG